MKILMGIIWSVILGLGIIYGFFTIGNMEQTANQHVPQDGLYFPEDGLMERRERATRSRCIAAFLKARKESDWQYFNEHWGDTQECRKVRHKIRVAKSE